MGLFEDSNEQEKSLEESVNMHCTPQSARYMLVTLYQHGGNPRRMFERHEAYMSSDINVSQSEQRRRELFRRLIEISDRHGGKLLREHRYFAGHAFMREARSGTEVQRARIEMREVRSTENQARLSQRYDRLNTDQKGVFDTVMTTLYARRHEDTTRTHGKTFILQGGAGVGKTYTLNLLRDMEMSRGFLTEIAATTRIAAALYKGGRTLHS